MTQIKRTPKKMRRRMKGGAEAQKIEEQIKRSQEETEKRKAELNRTKEDAVAAKEKKEAVMAERESHREEVEGQMKDDDQDIRKLMEERDYEQQKIKELDKGNIIENEVVRNILNEKRDAIGPQRVGRTADQTNLKILKDAKKFAKRAKVTLPEAIAAKRKADDVIKEGNIICILEMPQIKEVDDGIVDQIKRFIEYKLNTDIKGQKTKEEQEQEDKDKAEEITKQIAEEAAAREAAERGEGQDGGGWLEKRKKKKQKKKEEKRKEADKESGLEELSKITSGVLRGLDKKSIWQSGMPVGQTLLYFHTLQDTMEYIEADFKRMKDLINNIKGTSKEFEEPTSDRQRGEEALAARRSSNVLKIDSEGKGKFIETYNRIMLNGDEDERLEEEIKKFKEASYVTFRSDKLSTPKSRGNNSSLMKELMTDNETNLPAKRQYLLEFISYIYITRKNDVEDFLYYMEKIGELTTYKKEVFKKGEETGEADGQWEGPQGKEQAGMKADLESIRLQLPQQDERSEEPVVEGSSADTVPGESPGSETESNVQPEMKATFIPSNTFTGVMEGYKFQKGDSGTGYYPEELPSPEPAPAPGLESEQAPGLESEQASGLESEPAPGLESEPAPGPGKGGGSKRKRTPAKRRR